MNEHFRDSKVLPQPPPVTQAADGMLRRAWTIAEIEAVVAAGIISEEERFEMIGGEIVPLSPKGGRHEWVKGLLNRHLQRFALPDILILQETTLRLDIRSFVEPDFCIFRATQENDVHQLDGSRVLFAVEVADSSLAYDLGRKIGIYAAYGVREVWVVNANTLETRVHRKLGAEGYREVTNHAYDVTMSPSLVPEIVVCFSRLGLAPL